MASPSSSLSATDGDEELSTEQTKPKRLPRSAKKRLRYERIRQQHKEAPKKKKKIKSLSTESQPLGKVFKREATERLAAINQDSTAPVICIDCAYDDAMSAKELASLARQIGRCYSSNRRSEKPVRLVLTHWSNDSPLALECRRVNSGFDLYPIIFCEKSIDESYPSQRLVYLSPNGDNALTNVNEEAIHVIGGLVDESVRKNMTYQTCREKNITCCKLPIQTYMEHSTEGGTFNQILSINQVFDILLTFMSTKDWHDAFTRNIPGRKGWVMKPTVAEVAHPSDNTTETS